MLVAAAKHQKNVFISKDMYVFSYGQRFPFRGPYKEWSKCLFDMYLKSIPKYVIYFLYVDSLSQMNVVSDCLKPINVICALQTKSNVVDNYLYICIYVNKIVSVQQRVLFTLKLQPTVAFKCKCLHYYWNYYSNRFCLCFHFWGNWVTQVCHCPWCWISDSLTESLFFLYSRKGFFTLFFCIKFQLLRDFLDQPVSRFRMWQVL